MLIYLYLLKRQTHTGSEREVSRKTEPLSTGLSPVTVEARTQAARARSPELSLDPQWGRDSI